MAAKATGDYTYPAKNWAAVSPSDTANMTVTRGLWVGVGGDVVAVDVDGTACTFKNVPSGTLMPIRAVRVNLTSTTATDIVALY